VQLYLNTRYL